MCIAILNKSAVLSKKSLKNCWDNNNHGAGIGYIDGGEIRSYHESTSFDSFYEEYKYIRAISDKPLMLHFRIATHGMGKDMLHPHEVTHGKVTLIHNGIIRGLGDNRISDTREFAELLGNFRPKNVQFIDHKGVRGFAMQLLGGTNKVVLMDNRGEFRILNESLGHWDKAKDTWTPTIPKLNVKTTFGTATPRYPISPTTARVKRPWGQSGRNKVGTKTQKALG